MTKRLWAAVALASAAVLVAGGCGKKIVITQYPAFWTPELKSVLVVPFENATPDRTAGQVMSEKFANALMANQTYEVFSQKDLKLLADQADLQIASGASTDALATILRKRGRVQAILTGTVTTYAATQRTITKQKPIYAYDRAGRQYISHYQPVQEVVVEANVAATARLIRVGDGSTIHATVPAVTKVTGGSGGDEGAEAVAALMSRGRPRPTDRFGCLAVASDQAVARLVEEFAVVRKEIKVDKDAFLVAEEIYDNKWRGGKEFSSTDRKGFVVVNLPAACDRNRFRITIIRAETRTDLYSQEFIWDRAWSGGSGKAFAFDPSEIAAKAGGGGQFTAKLYSGPEPVLTADFKIVEGGRAKGRR